MAKRLFLFGHANGRVVVEMYELNGRTGIYVVTKNFNEKDFSKYMVENIEEMESGASLMVTINYFIDDKSKYAIKTYKVDDPTKVFRLVSNYFK